MASGIAIEARDREDKARHGSNKRGEIRLRRCGSGTRRFTARRRRHQPPAWAGGPQMAMSAEQSAHHAAMQQRALEIGLELMRREAEFRSGGQVAVPLSAPIIGNSVTPMQLPMDGGAPSMAAAAPSTEVQKEESMEDARIGTMGVSRGREDSPSRADEVEEVITTLNDKQLRVLDEREVLQHARLPPSLSMDEVFGGTVIHQWPGGTWVGVLRNVCRGATPMRSAACRNWRDSRCSSLVLLKPMVAYVFGATMPAVTMDDLEKVRDGLLEVLTWPTMRTSTRP